MDDITHRMISKTPITPPTPHPSLNTNMTIGKSTGVPKESRFAFVRNLTQLFGFRRTSASKQPGSDNMEFVKVDANSELRIAQAKLGKTFSTKLVGKLEELFDSWLRDTTDTYRILEDRNKRIAELEFAITNDPFLSMAGDLYADEATQIDVQGKLIQIDCADIRMRERMEDLLEQWGVTQNRLRSVAYNLPCFGDAFWSNKVTKHGVVRIVPIGIHQVKERLEFNPVQVQTDLSLQKGYITAINRSAKLQALFDTMENEEHEEFSDLFDTRLFGFAIDDDMVVPPWSVTHFRLNPDQSEFAPMGRPIFLKALAPFRQCNATMVLQSLARVMSFPITVYNVKTAPGMDEALQFEKINQVREEYENIGETGAGSEAFSVNTKIWAPEGLLSMEMHSPNIDINATGDIQMYQDRVAVASGIPKGYLVQEWGGFGNSAISLVEQFKPFARRVFTIQSAILDGLSNLFRLHFAITGEFDYKEPFVLSMKFPNEESSDQRIASKNASLELSKNVLSTVASVVGSINDPLPPEILQDILTKFSFLDQDDIKKWIKVNVNQVEKAAEQPDELGDEGLGGGGGGIGGGGGTMPSPEEGGMPAAEGEEGIETETNEPTSPAEAETDTETIKVDTTKEQSNRYRKMELQILRESRLQEIIKRYTEAKDLIYEKVIKEFSKMDEATINNRHYKYARIEPCNLPMYNLFQKKEGQTDSDRAVSLKESAFRVQKNGVEEKVSWNKIKKDILKEDDVEKEKKSIISDEASNQENPEIDEHSEEEDSEDNLRKKRILDLLS